ncbi:SGNH family hydrolase [Castellaniella sp.]|uniref:SGNH/GDSL hydrolase family protein n=1 Tax=Castellaniella sp. TaxID=1955812 RepID=UPI002AFDF3BC|nr:SGNH family hydrolase [Castellaniella sp.]
MPASKPDTPPALPTATPLGRALSGLFVTLLSVAIGLAWLMQGSIDEYWRQTYHQEPPWSAWSAGPIGQLGAQWQQGMDAKRQAWVERWQQFDTHATQILPLLWQTAPALHPTADLASNLYAGTADILPSDPPLATVPTLASEPVLAPETPLATQDFPPLQANPETEPDPVFPESVNAATPHETIVLNKTDRVFFVGDSMMQGVAPHVRRVLTKEYGIESLDLSKQSTGLAYPGFFNWPKTVETTFDQYPDIRLMVVFLGPNDPWAFAVEKGQPYAKFKSEAWETAYRARIRTLLDTARAHQATIIWLQAPVMKNKKLDDGMRYLNTLYATEVDAAQGIIIDSNQALGQTAGKFNAYADIDHKKVKVRIDDGVHFTVTGQKLLSQAILTRIQGPAPNTPQD